MQEKDEGERGKNKMTFDLKKDWMKLVISLLAITTALNLFMDLIPHEYQMYIFSGLTLVYIWKVI